MIRISAGLVLLTAALSGSPVSATVITPADLQGWEAYTYGTSTPAPFGAITTAFPRLGNGSAEIQLYDEGTTMVQWWYQFTTTTPLSSMNQLSFDWYVSSTSTTPAYTTPAFGMYVTSSNGNGYLIWEGAYNGTMPSATQDAWVSSDILGDKFWWNSASGTGICANAAAYETLSWFNTNCLGGTAEVFGLSPFLGNGHAGTQFFGAFDNVAYGFRDGASDSFNFEVVASTVPEPGTLTLLGLALAGLAASRRQKQQG